MSLARRYKDRILAAQTLASTPKGGVTVPPAATATPAAGGANASPATRAAAQIALRLTHDLRRLKKIKSIDLKIEAKRQMLPEYRDWTAGILEAGAGVGTGIAAEVLPTCMVWLIDTGDYAAALDLADFMFRHRAEMPGRYQRDAGTVVVEEIADAAMKRQAAGEAFPLGILDRVADLTEGLDMHDQVRAKLLKATGVEQLRAAEDMDAASSRAALLLAADTLKEAQRLHDRIGVKDRIKRAEKLLSALPASEQNDEHGGASTV